MAAKHTIHSELGPLKPEKPIPGCIPILWFWGLISLFRRSLSTTAPYFMFPCEGMIWTWGSHVSEPDQPEVSQPSQSSAEGTGHLWAAISDGLWPPCAIHSQKIIFLTCQQLRNTEVYEGGVELWVRSPGFGSQLCNCWYFGHIAVLQNFSFINKKNKTIYFPEL